MDPPERLARRTTTFDVARSCCPGQLRGVILGSYKWGYTDIWCNMTASGGERVPCRGAAPRRDTERRPALHTGHIRAIGLGGAPGPVVWDRYFHGELSTRGWTQDWNWLLNNTLQQQWAPAHAVAPWRRTFRHGRHRDEVSARSPRNDATAAVAANGPLVRRVRPWMRSRATAGA